MASLDSCEVVAMISSLCIDALLWQGLRFAQAHVETRRIHTAVTNCHGNSCTSRSYPEKLYRRSTLRRNTADKIQNLAFRAELIQTHHGYSAREKFQQLTPAVHYSTRPVSIDITPAAYADDQPHGHKHGDYRRSSVTHEWKRNACHRHEADHHADIF